jgi:hypothetical protein
MFDPVPAVPPVVAPPPSSFSVSVCVLSGVPFLAYLRFSRVVSSALRSAVTDTWPLPVPSVRTSSAFRLDSICRAKRASSACLPAATPPAPPAAASAGQSSEPEESVMVTFSVLRPFTDEDTSWAIPRTAPGSSVSAELPSMTAAVAGVASSANRSSSGSTSCTCGEATPWTLPIVRAISPSSARW